MVDETTGAPITKVEQLVKKDHFAETFSRLGTQLLEEIERPNIITFEQFEPFIPIFNIDKERYKEDQEYQLQMNKLYNRYTKELSINWYQPTIVIQSKENPVELYYLDRRWTRILSDVTAGQSFRDQVPSNIPKTAPVTRDDLVLDASIRDLAEANKTPEQLAYFRKVRADSALINTRFVDRNLNPALREKIVQGITDTSKGTDNNSGSVELFDDDE